MSTVINNNSIVMCYFFVLILIFSVLTKCTDPTINEVPINVENQLSSILPIIIRNGPSVSQNTSPEGRNLSGIVKKLTARHEHKRHQIIAAKIILQKLLLETSQQPMKERGRMGPVPKEISYHDAETIATIYTDLHGNITRCTLFEIKRPEESDRILAEFAKDNRPVKKINFRTMLSVITACQAIDPDFSTIPNNSLDNSVRLNNDPDQLPQLNVLSMRSVISGIVPGTKWCGLGDIAQDYEDLGKEKDLDKCCRAHDHCPMKLRSFRSGYGLVNWSLYTKSHCECDSLLYECLKGAGTPTAGLLGNVYFNVLQVQCIDDEVPIKCMAREINGTDCRVWGTSNLDNEKKMVFKDVRRQF